MFKRLNQIKLKHPKPLIIDGKKKVFTIKVRGPFDLEPKAGFKDVPFYETFLNLELKVVSRAQLKKFIAYELMKEAQLKTGRTDCWFDDIRLVHVGDYTMADQQQIQDLYKRIKEVTEIGQQR
jgi:hypothetical protein